MDSDFFTLLSHHSTLQILGYNCFELLTHQIFHNSASNPCKKCSVILNYIFLLFHFVLIYKSPRFHFLSSNCPADILKWGSMSLLCSPTASNIWTDHNISTTKISYYLVCIAPLDYKNLELTNCTSFIFVSPANSRV